jgi:hypothetical protein
MGWKAVEAVFARSRQSGAAFTLMLTIARYADDDGRAFPAISTIARMARLHRASVMRLTKLCEAADELEVTSRGHGPGRSNRYRVTLCSPQAELFTNGGQVADGAEQLGRKGRRVRPLMVASGSKKVAPRDPNPCQSIKGSKKGPARPWAERRGRTETANEAAFRELREAEQRSNGRVR